MGLHVVRVSLWQAVNPIDNTLGIYPNTYCLDKRDLKVKWLLIRKGMYAQKVKSASDHLSAGKKDGEVSVCAQ